MCLHYLVKLIARVLSPYIIYFSIGYRLWTFGIKFSLTVDLKQQFSTVNNCFHRVYWHGKSCIRGSQQGEDCKCWRTLPAHRGRVGTSWSAHYRRRSEGVAKTTTSVCCCWRRTVWTWTVTPDATMLLQLCIMTLPFNHLTAYGICRDCFQCSLTLSVTCSRREAL